MALPKRRGSRIPKGPFNPRAALDPSQVIDRRRPRRGVSRPNVLAKAKAPRVNKGYPDGAPRTRGKRKG